MSGTQEIFPRSSSEQALVLALETSCDESAAALMRGTKLLAAEVFSQIALHGEYGGVVPEVASRSHLRALRPLLELVLAKAGARFADLDAVAATSGPGLATSLMLGLSLAKGIAVAARKPFIPVNHIEGHLLSPFLSEPSGPRDSVGLVVSGGHTLLVRIMGTGTYRLLGKTVDDAAGEAFDKVGKLLGLPYPGGPNVSLAAERGVSTRFALPRSMLHSGDFNFSFSGLKTAVRYLLPKYDPIPVDDVCASFQEAVIDVLVAKAMGAVAKEGVDTLAISGGVSCNHYLRRRFAGECSEAGVRLLLAPRELCTDNAAMIAYVAALKLRAGGVSALDAEIEPNLRMLDWIQ
ncbi:MAG: tRNA (adenosine(37)-N6)-threonylcarbamoyltransferase complex transferase subunit TsaD [Verrucomicrobia bacterium]|nr:tRNA (adenosine(37)-N6)-threonylcarbamoyltransferase complex transferase subunit TsaD [Verrucomicrobiota bacterium]